MIKYVSTLEPKDCCGCEACIQICGHHALKMEENEEGFLYPKIDMDACVECHLCEKVCPMENMEKTLNEKGKALAIQYKKTEDLALASSGGGFIAIASLIIGQGGVVYGAAFDKNMELNHVRVDKTSELKQLQGSKYVQSNIGQTFKNIKRELCEGKEVYFTGTPCQVAGLKLFLMKTYDNLLTSDLVCHGIPSQKIFRNTFEHMERKYDAKITDYSFRDKTIRGWACSSSSSYKRNTDGKSFKVKYSKDMEAYFEAFIAGDLMRMNCYYCPFARNERVGDITLADFWGVRKIFPDFHDIYRGVSLILLNTGKGKRLFDNIRNTFYVRAVDLAVASASNRNLHVPTPLTDRRKTSYSQAFNDYKDFLDTYYKKNYFVSKMKIEIEAFVRRHHTLFYLISALKHLKK